MTEMAD